MSIKHKVAESLKWLVIAQVLSQLFRVLVSIYVYRNLGREDMAYVGLALSVTNFLDIFTTLGLNAAIIRRQDIAKRDLQNIFGLVVTINLVLTLALLFGSGAFASFYGIPELVAILNVSAAGFMISAVRFTSGALMVRDMRFKDISISQLIANAGAAFTSYLLVKLGYGYWAMVWGGIAYQSLMSMTQIAMSRSFVLPRFAFKESLSHISFGGYVMMSALMWYLLVTLDLVIAGKFWTPEVVGVYALALNITSMPMNRIIPLIKSVALPAFSKSLGEDPARLESHLSKSTKMSAFISIPLFWGIAASAIVIVPLFLGEKWLPAVVPLSFLCIAAPFRFFLELLSPVLMVKGHPEKIFQNITLTTIVMVIGYFLATYYFDTPAMLAAVWLCVYPLLVIQAIFKFSSVLGVSALQLLKGLAPIFTAGLLMLAAVGFTSYELVDTTPLWMLLVLEILLGAVVYLGVIFVLQRETIKEVFTLVKSARSKS